MIKVERLKKSYGRFTAVDDISFEARQGAVTGFLGPNGAGKSTTMRIMTGLTLADSGSVTIDGRDYRDIANPGREIGVLLDASAQHGGRTGKEVLTLTAITLGLPRTRVDEMLELVGLSGTEAKRRVRNYSLGMRQRLGLAQALMGEPKVLILDEPANGLDPAGIHWMRNLLDHFAAQGGTVLLSSHLLNEVEHIADDLVMIGNGKIVAQGAKEDLLNVPGCIARGLDQAALAAALAAAGVEYSVSADGLFQTEEGTEAVGRAAAAHGVVLTELRAPDGAGLENMFLQLTANDQRDLVEGAQA